MRRVTTLIAGTMLVVLLGLSADAVAQSNQVNVSVTLLDGTTTPQATTTAAPTAVATSNNVSSPTAELVTQLPVTGGGPVDFPLSGIVIPMVTLLAGCVLLVAIEAGRAEPGQ